MLPSYNKKDIISTKYCSQPGNLLKRFNDCFVGVTFPQAPITLFIIIMCFESPATTFHLVKAIRFTANIGYEL